MASASVSVGASVGAASIAARRSARMRRRSTRVERTRGPTRFTRASAVDAGDEWDPTTVPVLDAREVHARLAARTHAKARDTYAAFYSSWCVQRVQPSMPRVPEHPSPSSSKHKTENEKKLTSPRSIHQSHRRRTGCITTDPAAMILPIDDHMVHRGHGVFDTAHVCDGRCHLLDRHLGQFLLIFVQLALLRTGNQIERVFCLLVLQRDSIAPWPPRR